MNRRNFIQAAVAAPVVAALPFAPARALMPVSNIRVNNFPPDSNNADPLLQRGVVSATFFLGGYQYGDFQYYEGAEVNAYEVAARIIRRTQVALSQA